MSVQVQIDIANGAAHRWLSIELTSTPVLDADGHRQLDEVGTYRVVAGSKPIHLTQTMRVADFEHRYGDDVLVLIAKAGTALRGKYEHV